MNTDIENRVNVKIFIGFQITSEIRMHMNESQEWERVRTGFDRDDHSFREVHFQKKDYIGIYSTRDELEISEIREIEIQLRKQLEHYCPLLCVEKFPLVLFSQLFIR